MFFNTNYKDKKILITGVTGFKGSYLAFILQKLGAEIVGFGLKPSTNPSLFEILDLQKRIEVIYGDIREKQNIQNIINTHKPEVIFHLASQSLVIESYKNPSYTFETNINGTINLLEAIKEANCVKSLVVITSDKCYKIKKQNHKYKENDCLGGLEPYSASKSAVEIIVDSYRHSFFNINDYQKSHNTLLATARSVNVFGGGDWASNRLIPDCIKCLVEKKTIPIRHPDSKRPYLFVLDSLFGYIWLGYLLLNKNKEFAKCWNFGSYDNKSIKVKQIVKNIISFWGEGEYSTVKSEVYETQTLKIDSKKAFKRLKWKPMYSYKEGLQQTINWYKKFYESKNDIYNFTEIQLKEYIKKASKFKFIKKIIEN